MLEPEWCIVRNQKETKRVRDIFNLSHQVYPKMVSDRFESRSGGPFHGLVLPLIRRRMESLPGMSTDKKLGLNPLTHW